MAISYSNEQLRILVEEEYIPQQRNDFALKDVCSYFLYWAMEVVRTNGIGLFESSMNFKRVKSVLN